MEYVAIGKPSVLENNEYLQSVLHKINAVTHSTDAQNPQKTIDDLVQSTDKTIIAVGGDGMLNGVMNSVIKYNKKNPIAVIACGSGNAAQWNYHIYHGYSPVPTQRQRIDDSLAVILENNQEERDILNTTYRNKSLYSSWLSIGYSADIIFEREEVGSRNYFIPALRIIPPSAFFPSKRQEIPLQLEDSTINTVITKPLLAVFSASVEYFGHGIMISPHTKRGKITATVYDHSVWSAIPCLPLALLGKDVYSSQYYANIVRIRKPASIAVEADGERLVNGGECDLTIQLIPNALNMIVGKK